MVQTVRKIEVRVSEECDVQPYVDFNGDPYSHNSDSIRLTIDKRSRTMEHRYPELERLSYDNYDKLLEKYKLIDDMKKDNKTW